MNNHDSVAPPLPPPSGDVCPNCRAPIDIHAEFCPNCGAKVSRLPRHANSSFWPDLAHGLVSLGLGFLTLFFALGGSCAALILVFGGAGEIGSVFVVGALALVGFGGAWLCGRAFAKRSKKL